MVLDGRSRRSAIHIAIEASGAVTGGAARVCRDVVEAFVTCEAVRLVTVYVAAKGRPQFPVHHKLSVIDATLGRTPLARLKWQRRGLRDAVGKTDASVLLSLSNSGDAPSGLPLLTLVHTSLPFTPDALSQLTLGERLRVWAIRHQIKRALAASDATVVQTTTMQESLSGRYGNLIKQIEVIPPPNPRLSSRLSNTDRANAKLLYVGNDSAYKNLRVLFEATRLLRPEFPNVRLTATIPPSSIENYRDLVDAIGYVDDEALARLYSSASCLVMPSLAETVCLPLLEGMAAGLPVIAADRGYAKEICGPAAAYFDPHSATDLARVIAGVIRDRARSNDLAKAGDHQIRQRAHCTYSPLVTLALNLSAKRASVHSRSQA